MIHHGVFPIEELVADDKPALEDWRFPLENLLEEQCFRRYEVSYREDLATAE